jgi:hypothetical protein
VVIPVPIGRECQAAAIAAPHRGLHSDLRDLTSPARPRSYRRAFAGRSLVISTSGVIQQATLQSTMTIPHHDAPCLRLLGTPRAVSLWSARSHNQAKVPFPWLWELHSAFIRSYGSRSERSDVG